MRDTDGPSGAPPDPGMGPLADVLGIQRLSFTGGRASCLTVGREHMNPYGVVHGGVIASLIDYAMGGALTSVLPAGERCATLEIQTHYLAAVPGGGLRGRLAARDAEAADAHRIAVECHAFGAVLRLRRAPVRLVRGGAAPVVARLDGEIAFRATTRATTLAGTAIVRTLTPLPREAVDALNAEAAALAALAVAAGCRPRFVCLLASGLAGSGRPLRPGARAARLGPVDRGGVRRLPGAARAGETLGARAAREDRGVTRAGYTLLRRGCVRVLVRDDVVTRLGPWLAAGHFVTPAGAVPVAFTISFNLF